MVSSGFARSILHVAIFLDILAVGIIVPLLPYYAAELGAGASSPSIVSKSFIHSFKEPWVYGLLQTIYGVAQLIGGPVMGRISDTHGR
jgi:MFS family permease